MSTDSIHTNYTPVYGSHEHTAQASEREKSSNGKHLPTPGIVVIARIVSTVHCSSRMFQFSCAGMLKCPRTSRPKMMIARRL